MGRELHLAHSLAGRQRERLPGSKLLLLRVGFFLELLPFPHDVEHVALFLFEIFLRISPLWCVARGWRRPCSSPPSPTTTAPATASRRRRHVRRGSVDVRELFQVA